MFRLCGALCVSGFALISSAVHAQSCVIDVTGPRTNTRIVMDLQSGCSEAARATFTAASEFWADFLYTPVPIHIEAEFTALACDATSAVLGSAGPLVLVDNDGQISALESGIVYPLALANALSGVDLVAAQPVEQRPPDATMSFNSSIGTPGCLEQASWFFDDGTTSVAPSNSLDLYSVIQHELGHALGFVSTFGPNGDSVIPGFPTDAFDVFTRLLWDEQSASRVDRLTSQQRAAVFTSVDQLTWSGEAVSAQVSTLSPGVTNGRVRMYAPNPYEQGSSVSHLDVSIQPGELMAPFALPREVLSTRLSRKVMRDMGWQTLPDPPTVISSTASASSVTLELMPPNDTGGSMVISYRVTCNGESAVSGGTSITLTGLSPATEFSCTSNVETAIGVSDSSAVYMITTGVAEPPKAPEIMRVTTRQTSDTTATLEIQFSALQTEPTPHTYTASCRPSPSATRGSVAIDRSPSATLSLLRHDRDTEERAALSKLHRSSSFRYSGDRCATEEMAPSLGALQRQFALVGTDCSATETRIEPRYSPQSLVEYVIPVIFHVIYRSDGMGKVSRARINEQIRVLNEDFAGGFDTNPNGRVGFDTGIRFELNEIRYYNNDLAFIDGTPASESFKQAVALDPNRYLNIYTNDTGGVLGYASLPFVGSGSLGDGVVVYHEAVGGRNNGYGQYDQGRTLVHEIGHYLGMFHTFEVRGMCSPNLFTSGDLLVDTPPQQEPDFGQASFDCDGVKSALENFMNYSDDLLMDTFSPQQANRMICSLQSYRPQLYRMVESPVGMVTVTGMQSPLVLNDVVAGTHYECSVSATSEYGVSGPSNVVSVLAGDADGDGRLDFDDAFPLVVTDWLDSDSDGLGDNAETTLGTDPFSEDTDGDGYSDFDELQVESDPLDPGSSPIETLPVWLLYEVLRNGQ